MTSAVENTGRSAAPAMAATVAPTSVHHHDATRAQVSTTALGVCAVRVWESKKDPSERVLVNSINTMDGEWMKGEGGFVFSILYVDPDSDDVFSRRLKQIQGCNQGHRKIYTVIDDNWWIYECLNLSYVFIIHTQSKHHPNIGNSSRCRMETWSVCIPKKHDSNVEWFDAHDTQPFQSSWPPRPQNIHEFVIRTCISYFQ